MSRAAVRFVRHLPFLTNLRTDGELLDTFLADRNESATECGPDSEAAFAELVRRHGPLVWSVCRRWLPDAADAEDAFQAAFLVLVRRAHRLKGRPALGPWLHQVATWTARNTRRKNARHLARRVALPPAVPDPSPTSEAVDLRADIDNALLALPEKYRAPLILCHLQGWSRHDAAKSLGCPEGTLSSLLSRGLARLRDKLRSHDPAKVLAVPAVAVPSALASATVQAASAARLMSAGAVSVSVSQVVEGVLHMFWVKKATAATFALCVMFGAGVGVGVSVRESPRGMAAADGPIGATQPKAPARPDAEKEDGAKRRPKVHAEAEDLEHKLANDVEDLNALIRKVKAARDGLHPELEQLEAKLRSAPPKPTPQPPAKTESDVERLQALNAILDRLNSQLQLLEAQRNDMLKRLPEAQLRFKKAELEKLQKLEQEKHRLKGQEPTVEKAELKAEAARAKALAEIQQLEAKLRAATQKPTPKVPANPDEDLAKKLLKLKAEDELLADKLTAEKEGIDARIKKMAAERARLRADIERLEARLRAAPKAAPQPPANQENDLDNLDAQIRRLSEDIARLEADRNHMLKKLTDAREQLQRKKLDLEKHRLKGQEPTGGKEANDAALYAYPAGRIVKRSPGNVVEIDIGSNANLRPGATLVVLPGDLSEKGAKPRTRASRVPDGKGGYRTVEQLVPKGRIEVVEVVGPKLSRAKIVSEYDDIRDRVAQGDLLFSSSLQHRYLELTIKSKDSTWPFLVKEQGVEGQLNGGIAFENIAVLSQFLERTVKDVAGPKEVRIVASADALADRVREVIDACKAAGIKQVTVSNAGQFEEDLKKLRLMEEQRRRLEERKK